MPCVLPIRTERLTIRAFTIDDVPAIHAVLYADATAMHFIGGPHSPERTRQGIAGYIEHQRAAGYSFWAVTDTDSGELIGEAGLYPMNGVGPDIELGYALGRDWWGKGYATEAAGAILDAAFEHLGARRVVAVAKRENTGSLHVLDKLGFRFEGERDAWGARQMFFVCDRAPS
jgi:ribosomal-protein-alanine N-acetyltransferase